MAKSSSPAHPLSAVGIECDADALMVLPRGYLDLRTPNCRLRGIPVGDGEARLFQATIENKIGFDSKGVPTTSLKPARIDLLMRFASGERISSRIFGATFAWKDVHPGDVIHFTAKLHSNQFGLGFKSLERVVPTGKIQPIYPGIPGKIAAVAIAQGVQKAIANADALREAALKIRENLDVVSVLKLEGFHGGTTFLTDLHLPSDVEQGKHALRAARLACVRHIQAQGKSVSHGAAAYNIDSELIRLVGEQSEQLSQGQRKALNTIRLAINGARSAKILLNGDVGSGKSLVFLLAAASVASTGRPVAIMAPNDLVARQIAQQAAQRFPDLKPQLINAGCHHVPEDSRMLIGTQALLSLKHDLKFGLVVIDEQQKFSVAQRTHLVTKDTHVIEASATPIPRSLALALFDGWVEARIVGCPVSKRVISKILTPAMEEIAKQSIRRAVAGGKKTIMVYPSIKSGEKSAEEAFLRLDAAFPGMIAMSHGKMKPDAKLNAMESFRAGRCQILVSTSVVEVGVDIPGVATFIVHGAQTFGVSQLHQMRGRLVRDGGHGEFYMMAPENSAKDTCARLEAVRDNLDGFALAERDMELRGFGDVLGEAQSGGTSTFFRLAQLEASDFFSQNSKPLHDAKMRDK